MVGSMVERPNADHPPNQVTLAICSGFPKRETFSPGPQKFPAVVPGVAANAAHLASHRASNAGARRKFWPDGGGGGSGRKSGKPRLPRDRSSPPIAARDLFVSDGVGAPSQGVQRARLEVVGRALTGGTVQPGRGLDKLRGAPHPIWAGPFLATHQARNIFPRSPKVSGGSGLRSCECGASSPPSREQPRRALAPLVGSAGGKGQAKLFGN